MPAYADTDTHRLVLFERGRTASPYPRRYLGLLFHENGRHLGKLRPRYFLSLCNNRLRCGNGPRARLAGSRLLLHLCGRGTRASRSCDKRARLMPVSKTRRRPNECNANKTGTVIMNRQRAARPIKTVCGFRRAANEPAANEGGIRRHLGAVSRTPMHDTARFASPRSLYDLCSLLTAERGFPRRQSHKSVTPRFALVQTRLPYLPAQEGPLGNQRLSVCGKSFGHCWACL